MKLRWKLYLCFVGMIMLTGLLLGLSLSTGMASDLRGQIRQDLRTQAKALRRLAVSSLDAPDLQHTVKRWGQGVGIRLTVIRADGIVVADSDESPSSMDNHGSRPEVLACRAAPEQGAAVSRFSKTLNTSMLYLALPVGDSLNLRGYVRTSVPLTEIETTLSALRTRVASGTALAIVLALLPGFWLASKLTSRLETMIQAAHALSQGQPPPVPDLKAKDEVGELSRALHAMSGQLQTRMETVEADRHKLLAILSSMVEGVIAVDSEERIVHVNDVARDLLGLRSGKLVHQPIQLTVPVPEIAQILHESMTELKSQQLEFVHHTPQEDRVLSLHAAPLRGAGREVTGAALVIHDLTALRQLETLRRDFVANVSHELKTPLTAMAGFLETILEDDAMDPATRRRFLEKTQSQTSRLTSLVKDLLALSRVESQATTLERARVNLAEPAQASVQSLQDSAIAGGLELETEWATPPLFVKGDAEALQQAADNLISNAIRYTPSGGRVSVRVYRWGEEALLEVQDTGIGFAADHAERVFERFYRVDKARSRAVGGTGLGLSIVKHIALAHGGRVSVQSRPGEGSTFTLCLPLELEPPAPPRDA